MLETERLLIRTFKPCDIDDIYRVVYSDQEVLKLFSNFKGTRDAFAERFEMDPLFTAVTRFHYFAVVRKVDHAILGLMGFQNQADEDTSWLLMPDGTRTVGKDPARRDVELT